MKNMFTEYGKIISSKNKFKLNVLVIRYHTKMYECKKNTRINCT